ncbi:hypothetical protein GSU2173 [Geobacter sulfurreducens PCA]|uniref:Lipoprotein n=1 Tax=Geobacter sulfurreducens (strain ATCC 51573 / DSM 12127 / PCA) TaxID=243231 RepID=Q74B68_GEOSL|nr:hypothetical protein GSU2173 [Geobacter sulfurreducens PCA]HCD94937.1 hypothetical protein [Geobacter sulfurreducens]
MRTVGGVCGGTTGATGCGMNIYIFGDGQVEGLAEMKNCWAAR